MPNEFFTINSMLTLSGATGVTFIIANGIQRAFNINPRWLALAIAILVCLTGTYLAGGKGSDYVIAIVNGFLVFCTAAGATATVAGGQNIPIARGEPHVVKDKGVRRFLTPWS